MLTVGMAVYDDFDGVYFTVMSLLEHHGEHVKEVIVVDNNPAGKYSYQLSGRLRSHIADFCGTLPKVRYIALDNPKGTAPPRNAVFANASNELVMCIDSHVILRRDSVAKLIGFYKHNPEFNGLVQGPMYYDWAVDPSSAQACETHFTDVWSHKMWGQWGRNDAALAKGKPFDIPAQGLGLFACRKNAWLGFNPRFKGFGGEEWYIHLKYRQQGRRTICLPSLGWLHRFGWPKGTPYSNDLYDRVRNYIIGHRELGLPIDRCREHFINDVKFPAEYFERLLRDEDAPHPETVATNVAPKLDSVPASGADGGCTSCNGAIATQITLEQLYKLAVDTPSDINEHVPTLNSLARQCEHVTEFGVRHGVSTVGLLHAQPKKLVSYDSTTDHGTINVLDKLKGNTAFSFIEGDSKLVDIERTDMLFIDTFHSGWHLTMELERHHGKVNRYIVIHDTVIFGEKGEDGRPGILSSIVEFIRNHPEWTVIKHYPNNHGLIVLSRDERDKQALPSLGRQLLNFSKALVKETVKGKKIALEVASARFMECALCPEHANGKCAKCGCPVAEKTQWSEETCPLNKW